MIQAQSLMILFIAVLVQLGSALPPPLPAVPRTSTQPNAQMPTPHYQAKPVAVAAPRPALRVPIEQAPITAGGTNHATFMDNYLSTQLGNALQLKSAAAGIPQGGAGVAAGRSGQAGRDARAVHYTVRAQQQTQARHAAQQAAAAPRRVATGSASAGLRPQARIAAQPEARSNARPVSRAQASTVGLAPRNTATTSRRPATRTVPVKSQQGPKAPFQNQGPPQPLERQRTTGPDAVPEIDSPLSMDLVEYNKLSKNEQRVLTDNAENIRFTNTGVQPPKKRFTTGQKLAMAGATTLAIGAGITAEELFAPKDKRLSHLVGI